MLVDKVTARGGGGELRLRVKRAVPSVTTVATAGRSPCSSAEKASVHEHEIVIALAAAAQGRPQRFAALSTEQ